MLLLNVPKYKKDPLGSFIMSHFALVDISLGAHWHHFGGDILPPIIHASSHTNKVVEGKVLVYLPFEKAEKIMALLAPIKVYRFHLHCKDIEQGEHDNVTVHPFSLQGF